MLKCMMFCDILNKKLTLGNLKTSFRCTRLIVFLYGKAAFLVPFPCCVAIC